MMRAGGNGGLLNTWQNPRLKLCRAYRILAPFQVSALNRAPSNQGESNAQGSASGTSFDVLRDGLQ